MLKILKYYKYLFAFSGVILVAGLFSLGFYGLHLGIDFKGGTITELEYAAAPDIAHIRSVVDEQVQGVQLQTAGDKGLLIKTGVLTQEEHQKPSTTISSRERHTIRSFGKF